MIDAILLGIAQDGGVPHAGCHCETCRRARENPARRQLVVSLGLIDHHTRQFWLADATPHFPEQLEMLHTRAPDYSLAGILLTHAHVGHYTGLFHLGKEIMATRGVPVFASAAMCDFLRQNAPWAQLVTDGNISLQPLSPRTETALSPTLSVTPYPVPHRNEWSDTLAFVFRGKNRSLFFCPDIDSWEKWEIDVRKMVGGVDFSLVDASFFSIDELPHRNFRDIPHPPVTDTAARLAGIGDVTLIHMNHTNPLLHSGSARQWVAERGLRVGQTGMQWAL